MALVKPQAYCTIPIVIFGDSIQHCTVQYLSFVVIDYPTVCLTYSTVFTLHLHYR